LKPPADHNRTQEEGALRWVRLWSAGGVPEKKYKKHLLKGES
jgi:hypothetical protein